MKSFGLWAVAKCLWFADKLALSPPTPFPRTGLLTSAGVFLTWLEILFRGAVVMAPCLTEWGFRSRTSWTHWLGKKPFWPRRIPSSIPLALSSPLVTEKKAIWAFFCLSKKRATSTGVEIVPQDLTFGAKSSTFLGVTFQTLRKSNQRAEGQKVFHYLPNYLAWLHDFFTTEGNNWRVSKTKAFMAVLSEARCC